VPWIACPIPSQSYFCPAFAIIFAVYSNHATNMSLTISVFALFPARVAVQDICWEVLFDNCRDIRIPGNGSCLY
jgi:hypothetical protein